MRCGRCFASSNVAVAVGFEDATGWLCEFCGFANSSTRSFEERIREAHGESAKDDHAEFLLAEHEREHHTTVVNVHRSPNLAQDLAARELELRARALKRKEEKDRRDLERNAAVIASGLMPVMEGPVLQFEMVADHAVAIARAIRNKVRS